MNASNSILAHRGYSRNLYSRDRASVDWSLAGRGSWGRKTDHLLRPREIPWDRLRPEAVVSLSRMGYTREIYDGGLIAVRGVNPYLVRPGDSIGHHVFTRIDPPPNRHGFTWEPWPCRVECDLCGAEMERDMFAICRNMPTKCSWVHVQYRGSRAA